MSSQNSIFEEFYLMLMKIENSPSDRDQLVKILSKLNGLNYSEKIPFITTWTCTDMLLHVISLLKEFGKEEVCMAALCQLIVNVASKQKVVISCMSVNVILHGLKDVWFEILALHRSLNTFKDCCSHLLCAIAAVVYGNGAYIMPDILEWLTGREKTSGSVGELLLSSVSIELKKLTLQCLSGLCIMSESRESVSEDYLQYCLVLFIQTLQSTPPIKDVSHYRAIFAAHKGLQYILESPSNIHIDEIGLLLAILKKHLVFGLLTPSDNLPEVLTPIPIPSAINPENVSASYSSKPRSTKKKKKKNRQKTATDRASSASQYSNRKDAQAAGTSTSDQPQPQDSFLASVSEKTSSFKFQVPSSESEYSDTEGGQLSSLTSFALKIRQMAIGSLYSIIKKTSKVLMLGYWNSFLSATSLRHDVSLLLCITNDPAPKARVGALMVLSALLEGSKTFLALGIQKGDSTAYVSFSSMLISYVSNVHATLLKAIAKERSTLVLVHILKALSSLAANTPYAKLPGGLISNIFAKVKTVMLSSRDIDTRIGVLNVYISLMSNESLPEISKCMTDQAGLPSSSDSAEPSDPISTVKSWLIEDCLVVFQGQLDCALPVQIAVLQLLATSCKMFFNIVKHYLSPLTAIVCSMISDESATVRLHISKLAEELGSSLLRAQQEDKDAIEQGLLFWQQLLSGPLQNVVDSIDDPVSKSLMCNCLSTMGSEVFERLNERLQIYCQTLLIGLTRDEIYLVRSASIRALAVFIMYPLLRKDVVFVEDVAMCILELMKDQVKGVQYNAAWSFGNFTDAIIINVENDPNSFSRSMLRQSLLLDMIQCAIKSFDNKDKVRFNMMRVLGNIMRFCNEVHVADERFRSLLFEAKSIMVNVISRDPLMKVRWNACLACGNMLRNVHLPVGEPKWSDDVYNALTGAISSSKNYKVSIKAAIALGCPPDRKAYGEKFLSIYNCTLLSLKNSETNEVDIGEYKFKDKLQERLMYTLLHMTSFIETDDVAAILSFLSDQALFEFVQIQVEKWYNSLFIEHKLSGLNLDDADTYAALGQFPIDKKKMLFADASSRWQTVLKSSHDGELDKDTEMKVAKFKEVFSV